MITRGDILDATDRAIKTMDVPEWGGEVGIVEMSGGEREKFEAMFVVMEHGDIASRLGCLRATFLSWVLCDGDGKLLFTEEDIEALNGKNSNVLQTVFDEAMTYNGLTEEAVEELAGNSPGGPAADSGSS